LTNLTVRALHREHACNYSTENGKKTGAIGKTGIYLLRLQYSVLHSQEAPGVPMQH